MNMPHLAISYVEDFSPEPFEEFRSEVALDDLDLRIEPRPSPGPVAGLEWLIPTAIGAYIAKPYFDSFFKEAGKDHYKIVRAALKKLSRRFLGPAAPKVRVVSAGQHKIRAEPKYSLLYSITAVWTDGVRFKLLLEPELPLKDCDAAVDAFLSFVESLFTDTVDPELANEMANVRPMNGLVLLAFDASTQALHVIDPIPASSHPTASRGAPAEDARQ